MNLDQKIAYIGLENFVQFTNCDIFKELSSELKSLLKDKGFYSDKMAYPYFTTDGLLKSVTSKLVSLASNSIGLKLCIDLEAGEQIVVYNTENDEKTVVNSDLKKYIECLYAMRYFSEEIEGEDLFGDYYENNEKYAKKLLELFNEVEGDIKKFPLWYIQVHEREIGSL